MELKDFQDLTDQINIECFYMTSSQQEEKVIQLIDLHHFIESYNQSLKVIDYINHPINIIEDNGIKKGILFYDLKHNFLQTFWLLKLSKHNIIFKRFGLFLWKKMMSKITTDTSIFLLKMELNFSTTGYLCSIFSNLSSIL